MVSKKALFTKHQTGHAWMSLFFAIVMAAGLTVSAYAWWNPFELFYRNLNDELKKIKSELAQKEFENDRLRSQLNQAQLDISGFKEKLQRLEESVSEARNVKALHTLKTEKKKIETELGRVNQELKDTVFKLTKSTLEAQGLKAQIQNLEGQVKNKEQQARELKDTAYRLDKAIQEAGGLKTRIQDIETQLKDKNAQLKHLSNTAAQAEKINQENSALQKQLQDLQAQAKDKEARLIQLEDTAMRLDKSIQEGVSLRKQLQDIESRLKAKDGQIHTLSEAKTGLEKQLKQANLDEDQAQDKVSQLETEMGLLKKKAAEFEAQSRQLTQAGQKTQQDYDALYARYNEILLSNATLEKQIGELHSRISAQGDDIAQKLQRINSLEQDVIRLTSERDVVKAERDSLKESFENASKATIFLSTQFSQLKQTLEDKTSQLSKLDEEVKNIQVERDGFKERLAASLAAHKEITAQFNTVKDSVVSLQNKLADLSSALAQSIPTNQFSSQGQEPKSRVEVTLFPETGQKPQIQALGAKGIKGVSSGKEDVMHYNLGLQLVQQGNVKEAVKEFKKAVELNPQDADSYYNLAVVYDDYLKNKHQAAVCYQKYLELRPNAEDAETVREWLKKVK